MHSASADVGGVPDLKRRFNPPINCRWHQHIRLLRVQLHQEHGFLERVEVRLCQNVARLINVAATSQAAVSHFRLHRAAILSGWRSTSMMARKGQACAARIAVILDLHGAISTSVEGNSSRVVPCCSRNQQHSGRTSAMVSPIAADAGGSSRRTECLRSVRIKLIMTCDRCCVDSMYCGLENHVLCGSRPPARCPVHMPA